MSIESNSQGTNQSSSSMALKQMIDGYKVTKLIVVAAKLGIADMLKDGPKTSDDLAQSVGAHPQALDRVLRALASFGIFAENGDGKFELTPLAQPLQSGVPGSVRALATLSDEPGWQSWGQLHYSVMTGKPALNHVLGMDIWEYRSRNPEAARTFNHSMTELTNQSVATVVAAYNFSGISKIVDVGGGHGALVAAILKAYPEMRSILFDLPTVIEGSRGAMEAAGVAPRCELVGGDFFESVPPGGDLYIFQRVIHDWEDDRAVAILKNCRHAMKDNERLLVIELVVPPGNTPHPSKLHDIIMLVIEGGLERTEAEFRDLFHAAGFRLTRIVPTQSPFSIIEGVPV